MTDALLRHEPDGGNLEILGGLLTLSDGLEMAAYLSLFGGNVRDAGTEATRHLEWWGNKIEDVAARRLRSRTQYLIETLPLLPSNLIQFEDAASADLSWFTDTGFATYAGAAATIPALNTLSIQTRIEVDDREYDYVFTRAAAARVNL